MDKVTNSTTTTHRRTWWCDVCKKQGSHSTDRCFKNPLNVTHQRPDSQPTFRPHHKDHKDHKDHNGNGPKYYNDKKSTEKNEKNEKKEEVQPEKKDNIKTVTPCVPRPVLTGWAAKASIPIQIKSDEDITDVVPTSSGFVSITKEKIGAGVSSKRDMNYRIKYQDIDKNDKNDKNTYQGDGDYDEYNY
jgi:hypothetical protein